MLKAKLQGTRVRKLVKSISRSKLKSFHMFRPFLKGGKKGLPPVIVNSFPKSGTHLLAKLIADLGLIEVPILLSNGGYHDFSRKGPWDQWKPIAELQPKKYGNPLTVKCDALYMLPRLRAGQFVPAHLGYERVIERILKAKKARHFLIVRDLRDCIFSYVHYYLSLESQHHRPDWYYYLSALNNIEDQLIAVIEGRPMFLESYRHKIRNIERWMGRPDVMIVCYEHLIGGQGGGDAETQHNEIKKISSFMGMEYDPEVIERTAANLWGGKSRTFRAGKMGYWKDVFTPKVQAVFDRDLGDIQAKVQDLIARQTPNAVVLLSLFLSKVADTGGLLEILA